MFSLNLLFLVRSFYDGPMSYKCANEQVYPASLSASRGVVSLFNIGVITLYSSTILHKTKEFQLVCAEENRDRQIHRRIYE